MALSIVVEMLVLDDFDSANPMMRSSLRVWMFGCFDRLKGMLYDF